MHMQKLQNKNNTTKKYKTTVSDIMVQGIWYERMSEFNSSGF